MPGRLVAYGQVAYGQCAKIQHRSRPGPANSTDPVDRESSAVQAVAIFFPVTDLLNLGKSTENSETADGPFDFREFAEWFDAHLK